MFIGYGYLVMFLLNSILIVQMLKTNVTFCKLVKAWELSFHSTFVVKSTWKDNNGGDHFYSNIN